MRGLNYRRVFAFTGLFSLFLIYIFLWLDMIEDPAQRSGSDFSGLYTYGRIFQTRGIAYIHDFDEQKRVQSEIVGYEVVPIIYTHLPFNAPLAAVLVDEDYVGSFKRWVVVLLLVNALNAAMLVTLLETDMFTKEQILFIGIGAFLFFPTFSGFVNGREDMFFLSGVILWVWGVLSRKYFLAGLGLCLTAIRPQLALILAIPFLFRHRNVFWGFVLGCSVLAGINLALVGIDGAWMYVDSIRYIENTVWYEAHSFDMPTLSGILRRNFEFIDPEPVKSIVWLCYGLGIAVLSVYWYRCPQVDEMHLGVLTTGAIFLLPYAHYHDLILLLIPIFCLVRRLTRQNTVDQYYLAISPLIVSFLTALSFAGSGALKFPITYFVMFALVWLLIGSDNFFKKDPVLSDDQDRL